VFLSHHSLKNFHFLSIYAPYPAAPQFLPLWATWTPPCDVLIARIGAVWIAGVGRTRRSLPEAMTSIMERTEGHTSGNDTKQMKQTLEY
jgi:hypothetical protein